MKTALNEPGERGVRVQGYGRAGIVASVSAVLCASSLLAIPTANAAVPAFPNNVVVFPDRDFVTIEGYQDRIGQTGTVEVHRPGVGIVGSAKSVIAEGDVAFEINHPGGVCWGADTNVKVTPDIRPGDAVTIKFDGQEAGTTTVQDTYVNAASIREGNTVIVKGHVAAGVNRNQMEQRIIEPALKDTSVGRRDARAVAGAPGGDDGYISRLEFDLDGPNTFTATYEFDEEAAAVIAAGAGGARSMAWEQSDVDDNRQGLTIAEFGELGGPGMGGCPSGPLDSGPVAPTDIKAAKVNGDLKVNWTPAVAVPGTPAITGYRVTAVAETVNGAERVESGVRISDQKASGTTIKGLSADENYEVYVVSVSGAGETFPAAHALPETDTTDPTVEASPEGGTFSTARELTLTASEQGSDIFYTTDESDPIVGGVAVNDAILYKGPITVAQSGTFTYAAIDPSGNVSENKTIEFNITNDPVPAAPVITGEPKAGLGTAEVSWSAPNPGAEGLTITGYTVQAYSGGVKSGEPKKVAGDVTTLVYDGLTGDTAYQFTVAATNSNGTGAESEKSAAVTVQGAVVATAGPDQNVARRTTATPVTLDATGSTTTGATYKWEQIMAAGSGTADKVTLNNSTGLKPSFSLAVFNPATMTNNPLTFKLTVTVGTTERTDEVKVTPVPDTVTIASGTWRSGDLRISGSGSVPGATITIKRANGTVLTRVNVGAAVAPATGGTWSVRLRDNAAGTSNPGPITIESNVGGTAGPFAVSNK